MYQDPFSLLDGARETPFLSSLLFADPHTKKVPHQHVRLKLIDSSTTSQPKEEHKVSSPLFDVDLVEQGATRSELQWGEQRQGALERNTSSRQLPSSIRCDDDTTNDVAAVDVEGDAVDTLLEESRSCRMAAETVPTTFGEKTEELERRLQEQLYVHRQLNSALRSLELLEMDVKNQVSEGVIGNTLRRQYQEAIGVLNSGNNIGDCRHVGFAPPQQAAVKRPQQEVNFTPQLQTQVPTLSSTVRPQPSPAPVVSTGIKSVASAAAAPQLQAPRQKEIVIVRPVKDGEVYTRRVLRPRPVVAPTDSSHQQSLMKQVSIAAEAPTVTHFDRDSPAVSTSRRGLASVSGSFQPGVSLHRSSNQSSDIRDSVRLSTNQSFEGSINENIAAHGHGSAMSSSVRDSTAMTDSTASIKISYVNRHVGSVRKSSSSIEDVVTYSSSGTSSRSSVEDQVVLSSHSSFTKRASSSEPLSRSTSFHGRGDTVKPKELFEAFHLLCKKALDVVSPTEAAPSDARQEALVERVRRAEGVSEIHDAVRDVRTLRAFIVSLKKDVHSLEAVRKTRLVREKLLIKAKKIAEARQRMKTRKLSLAQVEDEIGVSLSMSVRRKGRGGDEIDDDVVTDMFDGSPSRTYGGIEDELEDEFDDVILDEDDDNVIDEFDDAVYDDEMDDEIGDEIDDEVLDVEGRYVLAEDEEEFADMLVEQDADELIRSPPAQLRLIRYGGAKGAQQASEQEVERNQNVKQLSRASSGSSFYSSIEDEEEIAERARMKAAQMSASPARPATLWATTDVDVVEEEGIAKYDKKYAPSTSSSSSSSSSIHTAASSAAMSMASSVAGKRKPGDAPKRAPALGYISTEGSRDRPSDTTHQKAHHARKADSLPTKREVSPYSVHEAVSIPDDDSSFYRSSASSGDADVNSLHPFSTPYTSETTASEDVVCVTSSTEVSTEERKAFPFVDRAKWMVNQKKRQRALRNIAPLHTFSELYDPCESTPTSRTSADTSTDDAASKVPVQLSAAAVMATVSAEGHVDGISPSSVGDITVSPMSAPSPTIAQHRGSLKLLVTPAELQALADAQSQRYPIKLNVANNDDSEDSSLDSSPEESPRVAESPQKASRRPMESPTEGHSTHISQSRSPPRGLSHTPPPQDICVATASDPTPAVSVEVTQPGDGQQYHNNGSGIGGNSISVDFVRRNRLGKSMDGDEVQTGVSPDQLIDYPPPPAPPVDRSLPVEVLYEQDDFVALNQWKQRQKDLLRSLWGNPAPVPDSSPRHVGATAADDDDVVEGPAQLLAKPDAESPPLIGPEEGSEFATHWGTLEAMLEQRFGVTSRSSSSSYYSSYSSDSSVNDSDSDEESDSYISGSNASGSHSRCSLPVESDV